MVTKERLGGISGVCSQSATCLLCAPFQTFEGAERVPESGPSFIEVGRVRFRPICGHTLPAPRPPKPAARLFRPIRGCNARLEDTERREVGPYRRSRS